MVVTAGWRRRVGAHLPLGNIGYQYFAGYSGGAKPSCLARVSHPGGHPGQPPAGCWKMPPAPGKLGGATPSGRRTEEAAAMVEVDFIVNVVLDAHKEIIKAVAGGLVAAAPGGLRLPGHAAKESPAQADIVWCPRGGPWT